MCKVGTNFTSTEYINYDNILIQLGVNNSAIRNRIISGIKTYSMDTQKKIIKYMKEGKIFYGEVSSLDVLSSITDYRKYDTEEHRLDEDVLIRII